MTDDYGQLTADQVHAFREDMRRLQDGMNGISLVSDFAGSVARLRELAADAGQLADNLEWSLTLT